MNKYASKKNTMKISIYDIFKSKLNKMCFDWLFFLQYVVIYGIKYGFVHLIVVKEVIQFKFPIWDNKFCHRIEK